MQLKENPLKNGFSKSKVIKMELNDGLDKCLDEIGTRLSRIVDRAWQRDMPQTSTEIIELLRALPGYSRREKQRIYDGFCNAWNSGASESEAGNEIDNLTASILSESTFDANKKATYSAKIAHMRGIVTEWKDWFGQLKEALETDCLRKNAHRTYGHMPLPDVQVAYVETMIGIYGDHFGEKLTQLELGVEDGTITEDEFNKFTEEFSDRQAKNTPFPWILNGICGLYITINEEKLTKLAASLQKLVRTTYNLPNTAVGLSDFTKRPLGQNNSYKSSEPYYLLRGHAGESEEDDYRDLRTGLSVSIPDIGINYTRAPVVHFN